ncbi:Hint domain-containing protein [Amylibacter sp. SFDW26]|uniref:Hint domain-containing protein n=1 Tax=Amylibacter sp. SFDW26 TaxID=2652722 RepID=UPI001262158F|nr:Hint domain-containing protein [Amylibacter sp. SFDW26]KAB7610410.1 Hint domain-containing protein [Amylibacter sp. SFDW26]
MALNPGDLMFVGWDTDNNDAAMLATTDIAEGEIIYFTDDEWNGTEFIGNEQLIEWEVPAGGIPAGTVITVDMFRNPNGAEVTVGGTGSGITDYIRGGGQLAGANEMFWAVQGTVDGSNDLTPTNFIGVIGNEADGPDTQTPNLTGTGLTTSNGAIIIDGDNDYMEFNADGGLPDPATQQELIDAISNTSDWDLGNGGGNNNPNGTGFDLTFPDVVCFVAGTKIATPLGACNVEDLRVGDLVITKDNGLQAIRWIGHKHISGARLYAYPHLRPILIRKDALGLGYPNQDLYVSPQHRMLVNGPRVRLITGHGEALVAAKDLVNGTSIIQMPDTQRAEYIHILFDRHELVTANGTLSESFYPGGFAMDTMEDKARTELFEIFPELAVSPDNFGQSARPLTRTVEARMLV